MPGLKSLAQELPKYGRYGDTIVAHINPQEAALLKALGGSGTINPHTGLPEYWGGLGALNPFNPGSAAGKAVGSIPGVKEAQNLATQVFQPVEKAVVQPVSSGLASFDKMVGNAIPGGWGTVAQVAGSFAGLPTPVMVGMGALTGSGVLRPGRSFNLQGALMGGAMAYGASQLGAYARGAAEGAAEGIAKSTTEAISEAAKEGLTKVATEQGDVFFNSQGQMLNSAGQVLNAPPVPPIVPTPPQLANVPDIAQVGRPTLYAGQAPVELTPEMIDAAKLGPPVPNATIQPEGMFSRIGSSVASGAESAFNKGADFVTKSIPEFVTKDIPQFVDKATTLDTYSGAIDKGLTNVGKTSSGIGNLLAGGESVSKVNPLLATGAVAYGGMGLMALEEQRKYLEEAKQQKAISDAEYNAAVAEIDRQAAIARKTVAESPFSTTPSRDVSIGETYYGRTPGESNLYARTPSNLYAMGGSIDDELGGDYSAMGMNQGNLQKGLFGMGYAEGGTPRFLSGGGDGMSDSIPATINQKQPARLADGEFVVPADVVSHLGNGSSKAGAKQLYSMMDRIRTARTGRKSQGKQVNPRKYMPA